MLASRFIASTVQILIYVRRNPSLTPAQFNTEWTNILGPLVVPLAEKHGFISYDQLHSPGDIASQVHETVQAFDGIVLLELPSLQTLTRAFSDPYYLNVVAPAEQKIFDWVNFPQGVVASYNGSLVKVVQDGKPV